MRRVQALRSHVDPSPASAPGDAALEDTDHGRNPATHWNGWGHVDTAFVLNADTMDLHLSGQRFADTMGAGPQRMAIPDFAMFAFDELGVDPEHARRLPEPPPPKEALPKPLKPAPEPFLAALRTAGVDFTDDAYARLRHAHGHTCQEVHALRFRPKLVGTPASAIARLPDLVALPATREQVRALIHAAAELGGVCLIPRGGGTGVSHGLLVPLAEARCVVSVDVRRLSRIVYVDRANMLCKVEAGVAGGELERRLNKLGLTCGHEPDSLDFSTVGGWVATRASGMKRARNGNIEDIVVSARMETPAGTVGGEADGFERASLGPELSKAAVLGSEGVLGIVVDAVLRLRPLPTVREYGSVLFKDMDAGVQAMRSLAAKGLLPASARLMDNTQYRMGAALRPRAAGPPSQLRERAKQLYIETLMGLDPENMAAMTLVFEGFSKAEVREQWRQVWAECKAHGGAMGDAESGRRGFFLTYMIAYLRDFGLSLSFVSESFETTVPWSRVVELCAAVKRCIEDTAKQAGVPAAPLVGCRVSQGYATCACVYFYYGLLSRDVYKDDLAVFSNVEHEARKTVLAHGGSLSHHHGVGKLRKEWFATEARQGLDLRLVHELKRLLDPGNVFAAGNLI